MRILNNIVLIVCILFCVGCEKVLSTQTFQNYMSLCDTHGGSESVVLNSANRQEFVILYIQCKDKSIFRNDAFN